MCFPMQLAIKNENTVAHKYNSLIKFLLAIKRYITIVQSRMRIVKEFSI